MSATVTVRAKAFGDRRLVRLAELAGYAGGDDEALGKMSRLWSLCAELQTDKPDVREIRACLGPRGEEHLVESGLGDDSRRDPTLDAGVVRVRGCDECDWAGALAEQRAREEGGRVRAETALRDSSGRFVNERPPDVQLPPASDHSPDLGSSSDLPIPELPDLGEIVQAEREVATKLSSIPARSRDDRRRKLFGDAWNYACLKHHELRAEGIDSHARSWAAMPPASSIESQLLLSRINELTEDDAADFRAAGEVIKNRVDVAAAEARRDKTLRWFIPARMWDAKSFAIAKDLSPAQAAQPRRSAKESAPEQPIRKMRTF